MSLFPVKDPKKIKRERISVHGFYRIGKVIGDGNFAVVRECKNRYVYLSSVISIIIGYTDLKPYISMILRSHVCQYFFPILSNNDCLRTTVLEHCCQVQNKI